MRMHDNTDKALPRAEKNTFRRSRPGIAPTFRLIVLLVACFRLAPLGAEAVRGSWTCVALGPSHLALTGDYDAVQQRLFRERFTARHRAARKKLTGWKADLTFDIAAAEAIAAYRPQVAELLLNDPKISVVSNSPSPVSVTRVGSWLNPIGQARFPDLDGTMRLAVSADVAFHLFPELSRPLAEGEKIALTLPAGEVVEFAWSEKTPSPLFKIDQVGYMPQAPKFAYVGAWLGTAGPLPLHRELDGREFVLADDATGETVFSGKLRARMADPTNKNGAPFTGEEVLELDFSAFKTPGKYHLRIPGVGRSFAFRIGDDTMAEAFYIHARGLFHQRCGIAKTRPHTFWEQKACHLTCRRGNFPPDIMHYGKGGPDRRYGFFDESGKSIGLKQFQLISESPPDVVEELHAPGGWHDAGDWDRRPQHMAISGDLAAVYLLKPENFCDGQLDIPESGNGLPDILDEARWGLEHLRLHQQPDGGVGTWIEAPRHPRPGHGMASDDKLVYYLSCATRNGTLEYASYASLLALAMRKAGNAKYMEEFRNSAARAWDYALDPENGGKVRRYRLRGKTITYREEPELAPELLVKAGFNLFTLTGDAKYLRAAEDAAKSAERSMRKNGWRRSPLFWIGLEIFPCDSLILDKLRASRRRAIEKEAKTMLRQQENNYPVRAPWYGPRDGWVHTMGWGTHHPLSRARTLIAAHAMTGNPEFLDGALLANDFNNGANPSGSSMTSGLGRVYPVRFLDLNSYADGIAEFVPGITPYRNTYGIPRDAIRYAYGLYYRERKALGYRGLKLSLFPRPGLSEDECARQVALALPIWRRWCNVETRTVAASEYTVWETIGPAAAVTGYLLNGAAPPDPVWNRRPADDIRKLPGYAPLP